MTHGRVACRGDLSASKLSFNSDRLRGHLRKRAPVFIHARKKNGSFHRCFCDTIAVVPLRATRMERSRRGTVVRSSSLRSGTGIKTFQPASASRRLIIYSYASRRREKETLCRNLPLSNKEKSVRNLSLSLSLRPLFYILLLAASQIPQTSRDILLRSVCSLALSYASLIFLRPNYRGASRPRFATFIVIQERANI